MTIASELALDSSTHQEKSALLGITLADAELRFQAVVESLAEGLAIFDTTGVLVFCNSGFEQLTGYSRDEMFGKRIYEIFFPPGSPEQNHYFDEMLDRYRARSRGRNETYRSYIYRKNGERRCIETKAGPFRDIHGNIIGSIGANTDITDKTLLEEQLQLSHRLEAAQNVAASVAANFGDLLTALGGQADALMLDPADAETNRYRIQVIRDCTEAARKLTHYLSLTTHPPARHQEPIDLNDLMKAAVDITTGIVGDSLKLEVSLIPDSLPVTADRASLQQALISLILYVRKTFGHGGKIRLETAYREFTCEVVTSFGTIRPGKYMAMVIEHTSRGNSSPDSNRLFYLSTGSEQPEGRRLRTEIELFSSHALIKQFGGEISITALSEDTTSIDLYLPVSAPDHGLKKQILKIAPKLSGNETVSIVEENSGVREFIIELLGTNGYRTVEPPALTKGSPLFSRNEQQPELIIASVRFGGDILRFARKILSENPGCRILLLSANTWDTDTIEELESLGAAILEKPFSSIGLLQAIRNLLDKKLTARLHAPA